MCLLVVASAVLTRGLHGAGCTGCHGNCCAWSGVTSRAVGTGPAAPPGVLLALTQQHECGLAPHAWDLGREAERACSCLVLPYVLYPGENTRTMRLRCKEIHPEWKAFRAKPDGPGAHREHRDYRRWGTGPSPHPSNPALERKLRDGLL